MKFYSDEDAELSLLEGKTVGFVGYGNQGRSQALNLRDSGVSVIVGNPCDSYADQAKQDGMEVVTIAEAVRRSDIIPILIPDELQPDVYAKEIAPNLRPGQALDFAQGAGSLNLDQFERQMIERALRMHHFNVSLAASELCML